MKNPNAIFMELNALDLRVFQHILFNWQDKWPKYQKATSNIWKKICIKEGIIKTQ